MKTAWRFTERYGPWAVVAGASAGLGAAFATGLAARGISLVLVARRQPELNEVADRLETVHGVSVRRLVADLARPETTSVIQESCRDIDPGLLVYNAAYAPIGPFTKLESEAIHRVVAVNVEGPIRLISALAPQMTRRHHAGILLMSSLAGEYGSPGLSLYAASKAFTTRLGQGLWYELRAQGVDVTTCVAGAVRTPGYTQAAAEKTRDAPGTLDANAVAEAALSALGRKQVVVPGAVNRIARFVMSRLLASQVSTRVMGSSTRGLSADTGSEGTRRKERGRG